MKRFYLLIVSVLLFCLGISHSAYAVPAKRGVTRELVLTDGSRVTAVLVGDEHGHYWLAADGTAYQAIEGTEVYASVDRQQVVQRANVRRATSNARRQRRMAPRRIGEVGAITGKKKGLIILVNFSDVTFNKSNTNALYQRIANEENFTYGNFKGSMRDYFYAQSEGQFELTFDVVGPVSVSKAQSDYGANDSNGDDQYPATMVIEALEKADSQVNYADYDWDGDGEVEQVYVVYAGKGEADGGAASTIWPHEWELSAAASYGDGSGAQTLDGVTINTYACGAELNGATGTIAGIGTMCHEFSHCLGYPDFYDTDYSGGQGMGYWDLMDSGSYNDDGYQPAGYTSYERWVAGWKTPTELTSTTQVDNMKALQANGSNTYVIYNSGNKNEYYLLENRQKTGWDASLPGEGLLILHVDYSASAWSSNTPNDTPSHQRMTWIAADNKYQYEAYNGSKYYTEEGMANDPYPYGSVNAFGESTTPAAKLFNKNAGGTYYLDSSVENITQNADGTVSFKFRAASNVATPTFSPKAGRYAEAQTVSISCTTDAAAIYYTLDGTTPSSASTLYTSPITISETTVVKAVAVLDGEESKVASGKFTIGASTSDPNTITFTRVASVDDLEPGMRYIIACGSKARAAGAVSNSIMGSQMVTVSDEVITIGNDVEVFVLEQAEDGGWTFMNETTGEYLYATTTKKLAYASDEKAWTLTDGTDGVTMTFDSYGTMLYNVNNPRFTTYTSSPNASMIQANLYMEDSSATPSLPTPFIVADEALTFNAKVGAQHTMPLNVLSENLTDDIALALTDAAGVFSLSTTTINKAVEDAVVQVTFAPTAAGSFSGSITLTSAGAEAVMVTLTATATENGSSTGGEGDSYQLVGDANLLAAGDEVLIAYIDESGNPYALSTTQNDNNRSASSDLTLNADGTLTPGEGVQIITLEKNGTNYLFNVGSGYLYAASSSKNYLRTESTADDNAKADISIADGMATIIFQGTNTRNVLRFNPNNSTPIFSCYDVGSSVGSLPQLYRKAAGNLKHDATLTFSATTATATVGEDFTAPSLTTDPADINVTYASSKPTVAEVDATSGAITILEAGTTIITATFAGNDNYNGASAFYVLTVKAEATGDENSADNPYTVAEAQALFDNDQLPEDLVFVKGVVASISEVNTQYGNATYNISDDGTEDNQLLVYRGKYLDGDAFTSADQLQVGDTVVVYGSLILYKNTTREFTSGNYIVSLARPEGTTPAAGDYVKVTSAPDDWSGQYLIVYEEGSVAMNGGLGTLDAISNTINVTISDNTISSSDATDAASFTIEAVVGGYTIKSASGYYIGQTSDANGLKTSAETAFTNTLSMASDGVDIVSDVTHLRYNMTSGQTRFRYFKSATYTAQQPIALYRKVAAPVVVTLGDVNKDGFVTIADVTALVNIILGKDTNNDYDSAAADVNGDEKITIADVTALVNLILGKS